MGGEPWCFTPEQIAPLTDSQIEDVYLKPALAKQDAMERERKGLPPKPADDDRRPLTEPPPRAAVVGMMRTLGMSVEKANAEYDRQLAEWEAQRGNRTA